MGRRNLKGTVSICKDKNTIRLRWRYNSERYSLNLFLYNKQNLLRAKKIAFTIEHDLSSGGFDPSLDAYKVLIAPTPKVQPTSHLHTHGPTQNCLLDEKQIQPASQLNLFNEFEQYIKAKSMDPYSDDLSSYYTQTRAMIKNWGNIDPEHTPVYLNKERFGPKTFNDRRNCLFKFFNWLTRKGKITSNPLAEVATKKRVRNADQRKPFTETEVSTILDALKYDRFKKKCSRYSHAQYYPLVAFMMQTGVRNAEAVGLQVGDVLWESEEVRICRALARTSKGANEAARREKGTKTNNVRFIPMNEFLSALLKNQCAGKSATELVFTNQAGRMIDDRMFLRRTFKPLLEALRIPERDLYACRHTFATRAVQAGLKAHEVAYLMGDNLQTVIANYYHK
ncbi:site-specific integrase [Paracnuella aquatica]|uniref:site-specific integrase n=1 Tax=Paracnuella aquatica TaxID=2268757 RepID=UPI000DF01398|nr:site-specific integrase [Paracnuella aquatica]RPD44071.1 site-specific integrase [Paracnuella aquatica]